jgi:hypothetical protein
MDKPLLIVLTLWLLLISSYVSGQADSFCKGMNADRPGIIHVYADPKLNELVYIKKFLENPNKETEIPGYRIQIYIGADRAEANKIKNEFGQSHPDEEAYVHYDSPNFKVRAGNFRNKIEAQKLLHELKEKYDGAFIVPDKIRFPRL